MTNSMSANELKLIAILKHAPVGLVETTTDGYITFINMKAEEILNPIIDTHNTGSDNVFPILEYIASEIAEKIKAFHEEGGVIHWDTHVVKLPMNGETTERHMLIMANKQIDGSIMISFDDATERVARENAIRRAEVDKAVEQGKFEIASGVLHDIGNAVVGFGSYLTRIRRLLEQNNLENLQGLVGFFAEHRTAFVTAIGEERADAVIDMLTGINKTQEENYNAIGKSITEQLNIITHIQEILNIQRQYVSGRESQERKPVNIRSIVNDCLAMLFASLDKRGIAVSLDIATESPIVKGDRTKLMQVILNILKNSLEAIDIKAEQKSIAINLDATDATVTLQVKDSGHGFDDVVAGKLFERNFTTKSSGSGIGLYNCMAIVESHSGSMSLTSEGPGKGATTTIKFNMN